MENVKTLIPGTVTSVQEHNYDSNQTLYLVLKDKNNLLKTVPSESDPQHSSLIAVLGKGKTKNVLRVWRIYDSLSEKNSMRNYDLPAG